MPKASQKTEPVHKKKRRPRLGLVASYIGDLHTGRVWQGVSRAARDLDFDLVAFVVDGLRAGPGGSLRPHVGADLIPNAGLDGLIVLQGSGLDPTGSVTRGLQARSPSLPMVTVGVPVENVASIRPDWETGMRAALEHLIDEHGCKNIVLWTALLERWVGVYKDVLAEHGIPFNDSLVVPWDDRLGGKGSLLAEIAEDVGEIDAVIVPSQAGARNMISTLHSRRLLVPDDVKVIGFGSYDTAFMGGFLTEVRESVGEMGQTAARMMLDHIRDGVPLEDATMPVELVVRGSCGCTSHWGTVASGGTSAAAAQVGAETVASFVGAHEELFAARAERLLQALERELKQGAKGEFSADLLWMVHQEDKDTLAVDSWKRLVLLLQRQVLHTMKHPKRRARAKRILADAWSGLERALETEQISTDLIERDQATKLFSAYRWMGKAKNIAALNEATVRVVESLNISNLFVVVGKPGETAPESLLSSVAAKGGAQGPTGKEIAFADLWKEVKKRGFLGVSRRTLFVMSIFPLDRAGLMFAEESLFDGLVYERLREAIIGGLTNVLAAQVGREKGSLLESVVRAIDDPVYAKDLQGRFILANRRTVEQIGAKSQQDLLGKTDADMMDEKRAAVYRAQEQKIISTGEPLVNFRDTVPGPDGEPVEYLVATKVPLKDADGKTIGIAGVNHDITELRKAEERFRTDLERQRGMLRDVMDCIGSAVYVKDTEGRFMLVNRACLDQNGFDSEEEMVGKTDFDLMSEEYAERYRRQDQQVIETGEPLINWSTSFESDTGKRTHLLISKTPLMGSSGKTLGIVGVNLDITEIRSMQRQLQDKERELYQAQKLDAVGQLAGGISHDFNNLLAVILGYAEHVKRDTGVDESIHEAAEMIEDASKQAATLVRQLLDFSRQGKTERRPIDIHGVIHHTITMITKTFDKRIEISHDLQASPSVVAGDAVQLQQVVLNLAVNARDAMKKGGELVFSSYTGRVGNGYPIPHADAAIGKYVVFGVSDTGHGIPPDIRDRIFEPFFTTKKKGSGTGMGLATTYGIVKNHGGWIDIESEEGKGSKFTVWIPIAFSTEAGDPAEADMVPLKGQGRILVVDDEPGMRRVLERTLTRLGYNVVLTSDGAEGLKHFRKSAGETDLVILDWDMPKMGGRECLEGIKKARPDAKVIISSGFLQDWDGEQLSELDVAGYIKKPYTHFAISKCLDEVLNKSG